MLILVKMCLQRKSIVDSDDQDCVCMLNGVEGEKQYIRREDGVGQICKKALEDMSQFMEPILLTEDNKDDVKSLDRSGVKHELL